MSSVSETDSRVKMALSKVEAPQEKDDFSYKFGALEVVYLVAKDSKEVLKQGFVLTAENQQKELAKSIFVIKGEHNDWHVGTLGSTEVSVGFELDELVKPFHTDELNFPSLDQITNMAAQNGVSLMPVDEPQGQFKHIAEIVSSDGVISAKTNKFAPGE